MEAATWPPPISHSSGGNLPWFIRRPSRIVAAIIAAAVAYLATSRLPDELNLLIPYDVALAVYFALFGVFMQWASPEDGAEIARRGEPHSAPVMIAVIALSAVHRLAEREICQRYLRPRDRRGSIDRARSIARPIGSAQIAVQRNREQHHATASPPMWRCGAMPSRAFPRPCMLISMRDWGRKQKFPSMTAPASGSLETRRWRKRDSNFWSHLQRGRPYAELASSFFGAWLHRLRSF
jgi:hypothetical protein